MRWLRVDVLIIMAPAEIGSTVPTEKISRVNWGARAGGSKCRATAEISPHQPTSNLKTNTQCPRTRATPCRTLKRTTMSLMNGKQTHSNWLPNACALYSLLPLNALFPRSFSQPSASGGFSPTSTAGNPPKFSGLELS